nr:membrane protein insertion efficiency factor YidD [Cellulomonas marina]
MLVLVVRAYQLLVSPMTPPSCRYHPSCSSYAVVALERHGLLRGGWLAVRRLGRCHPWAAGGVDDVPGTTEARGTSDAWDTVPGSTPSPTSSATRSPAPTGRSSAGLPHVHAGH